MMKGAVTLDQVEGGRSTFEYTMVHGANMDYHPMWWP